MRAYNISIQIHTKAICKDNNGSMLSFQHVLKAKLGFGAGFLWSSQQAGQLLRTGDFVQEVLGRTIDQTSLVFDTFLATKLTVADSSTRKWWTFLLSPKWETPVKMQNWEMICDAMNIKEPQKRKGQGVIWKKYEKRDTTQTEVHRREHRSHLDQSENTEHRGIAGKIEWILGFFKRPSGTEWKTMKKYHWPASSHGSGDFTLGVWR